MPLSLPRPDTLNEGIPGPTGPPGATGPPGPDGPPGPSTGPAGGDLSGTYPNPQIAAGVITDVDVNAANKDGAAATASMRTLGAGAQQAASGTHTHAGGLTFYPDPTDAADIATYSKLRTSPSTAGESTVARALTGTSDVLVGAFVTDAGVPGAVDFPAGTAARNIYAMTTAGTARLHLLIYVRNAAGVETLVRDEVSPDFVNTAVAVQSWTMTTAAVGSLLATDRLVMKLYAQRVAGPTSITVTTYFEGTAHTSAVQTSIPAGAPIGAAGGDLTGTYPSPTIADGAVTSVKIADGSIVEADLAAAFVTTIKGWGRPEVYDEGTPVVTDALGLNFVGAGVTATNDGLGNATVTVPGAAPTVPTAIGYRGAAANQAISNAVFTVLDISGSVDFTSGTGFSLASNVVTFGTAGIYSLDAAVYFNAPASGGRTAVVIEVWSGTDAGLGNAGQTVAWSEIALVAGGFAGLSAKTIKQIPAGAKARATVYQATGAALATLGSLYRHQLNILRIG